MDGRRLEPCCLPSWSLLNKSPFPQKHMFSQPPPPHRQQYHSNQLDCIQRNMYSIWWSQSARHNLIRANVFIFMLCTADCSLSGPETGKHWHGEASVLAALTLPVIEAADLARSDWLATVLLLGQSAYKHKGLRPAGPLWSSTYCAYAGVDMESCYLAVLCSSGVDVAWQPDWSLAAISAVLYSLLS